MCALLCVRACLRACHCVRLCVCVPKFMYVQKNVACVCCGYDVVCIRTAHFYNVRVALMCRFNFLPPHSVAEWERKQSKEQDGDKCAMQ